MRPEAGPTQSQTGHEGAERILRPGEDEDADLDVPPLR